MSLPKYIFFCSLEYLSALIFILTQFRFSVKENIGKILLLSVFLSFVSFSLINADMRDIGPIVQNLIFLIYIWVVLKVSFLNAVIMLLTGYTVFGLVQTCILALHAEAGLVSGVVVLGDNITYQIQALSSIVMLLLSLLTLILNGGFSFVGIRGRIQKRRINRKVIFYFIYIVLVFILTMLVNLYLLTSDHPSYIMSVLVLLVALSILFYLSFKRDESVD